MYIQVRTRRGLEGYGLGQSVGPFEGTFKGTIYGDESSSTAVTATFTHRGAAIKGSIVLGDGKTSGLQVRFGPPCNLEPVDVTNIPMDAKWDPANPNHAEATTDVDEKTEKLNLGTIKVRVSIVADLQPDGKTVKAKVTLKPTSPFLTSCGSRTLDVTLTRS